MDDTSMPLGTLLRQIRKERGYTQEGLAERSGISASFIARIEQGRANPSVPNIYTLADALSVEPARLLGNRERLEQAGRDRGVLGVRDVILAIADLPGEDPAEGAVPAPVSRLEQAVRQGWDLYWGGHLALLAALLPPLITSAMATERETGPAACRPLSQAYQLAADLMVHMGDDNLAFAAARSALRAAWRGDDPLQHATLKGTASWILLHQGRLAEAEKVAAAAAVKIEPAGKVSLRHLNVYGALLLSAAAPAAAAGNADAVQSYMAEASMAALRFTGGDRHDYNVSFGPTQLAMQKTHTLSVLGKPDAALKAARRVNRDDLMRISWGAHHLDVAQSSLARGWVSAAVDSLWTAYEVSPEWARHQGPWRSLVWGARQAEGRLSRRTQKLVAAAGLRR